jgi:hypothetical protein
MDTRLVRQIGQIPLMTGAGIGDDVAACKRDPRIGLERRLVEPPPLAQLVACEGDAVGLGEVGPVALRDQLGDAVRVIQGRCPHDDVVHCKPRIGWPP